MQNEKVAAFQNLPLYGHYSVAMANAKGSKATVA
jgi:hypothetical protein